MTKRIMSFIKFEKKNPAWMGLKQQIVKLGTLIMLMKMGNFVGIPCLFLSKEKV